MLNLPKDTQVMDTDLLRGALLNQISNQVDIILSSRLVMDNPLSNSPQSVSNIDYYYYISKS
jgi:hypothetical protein